MAVMTFQATVSRIQNLTHDVRELELLLREPKDIQFKAGQFISFEVMKEGLPFPLTRPYSMASPPSQSDRVTLLFNRVIDGPGSTYLYGLRAGDLVSFKGPAGNFYLREDAGRHLVFVATGTGIAPLRSMILAQFERPTDQPVTLFWGLRNECDLYYQDELAEGTRRYPNFSYETILSKPGPAWRGAKGRVTSLVQERITSVQNLALYLCGRGDMIKEVTALIQAKGLCPIYREQYY
jgi:CDP-4-dehydro-6-deoxyglucose reductase, E3